MPNNQETTEGLSEETLVDIAGAFLQRITRLSKEMPPSHVQRMKIPAKEWFIEEIQSRNLDIKKIKYWIRKKHLIKEFRGII